MGVCECIHVHASVEGTEWYMSGSVPFLNESPYRAIGQLNDFNWDVG